MVQPVYGRPFKNAEIVALEEGGNEVTFFPGPACQFPSHFLSILHFRCFFRSAEMPTALPQVLGLFQKPPPHCQVCRQPEGQNAPFSPPSVLKLPGSFSSQGPLEAEGVHPIRLRGEEVLRGQAGGGRARAPR